MPAAISGEDASNLSTTELPIVVYVSSLAGDRRTAKNSRWALDFLAGKKVRPPALSSLPPSPLLVTPQPSPRCPPALSSCAAPFRKMRSRSWGLAPIYDAAGRYGVHVQVPHAVIDLSVYPQVRSHLLAQLVAREMPTNASGATPSATAPSEPTVVEARARAEAALAELPVIDIGGARLLSVRDADACMCAGGPGV